MKTDTMPSWFKKFVLFALFLFGLLGLWIAKYRKRNLWAGVLIAVGCGVIIFLPFRAYKIAVLDPALQHAISSDAIRKTQEITIPGFPHAYNPSLIAMKDGYLLSFRVKSYSFPTYIQKIGNVRT